MIRIPPSYVRRSIDEVAAYKNKSLHFSSATAEKYNLTESQSVNMFHDNKKDILYIQLLEDHKGDFRLRSSKSHYEISCAKVFNILNLKNQRYPLSRDPSGMLKINIID
jgi:hypothetical protein